MDALTEALDDLIDARIEYRNADPEWRSTRDCDKAREAFEQALQNVIIQTVRDRLRGA